MDGPGLGDWETQEIQRLENDALQCSSTEDQLAYVVKAAELCSKYYGECLSHPVRSLWRLRLLHFLDRGEILKTALATGNIQDQVREVTYTRFVTPLHLPSCLGRLEANDSDFVDNPKQQRFLIQRSKFGSTCFFPWKDGDARSSTGQLREKSPQNPSHGGAKKPTPVFNIDFSETDSHGNSDLLSYSVTWAPANRALGTERLTMESMSPLNLVQDLGRDCSVVASICAFMAQKEVGNKIISSIMFPSSSLADQYSFRFYFNGCWRHVTVDTLLPILLESDSQKNRCSDTPVPRHLHVIDQSNPSLLWPALMEKAYLGVWGGYNFAGSNSNTDLLIMTGWIPELVILHEEGTGEDSLWPKLFGGFHSHALIATFGTGEFSSDAETRHNLISSHAYAVVGVDHRGDIELKNPWKPLQSINAREQLHQAHWKDTFKIGFEQARKCFKWAYLNWYPGLFRKRRDCHFGWVIEKQPRLSATVPEYTPQFAIENASKQPQLVWVLLMRHFQDNVEERCSADAQRKRMAAGHISLIACRQNGQKVFATYGHTVKQTRSVDAFQVLLRMVMPESSTYTIVPTQEDADIGEHFFTLSAFSDAAIYLRDAVDTMPHSVSLGGEWLKDTTAFGSIDEALFHRNPQYCLEVLHSGGTQLTLSLQSWNPAVAINIMLYHSGKQVFTVKQAGIVLGKPEYQLGYCLAYTRSWKPLEAGKYTILVSTQAKGQETQFTLRCQSSSAVRVTRIQGEETLTARHKLPRAPFAQGIKVLGIALHFKPHVQTTFRMVAYYVLSSDDNQQQSPVRLSIERGHGPYKQVINQTGFLNEPFLVAPKQGLRLLDTTIIGDDAFTPYFLVVERAKANTPMTSVEVWDIELICDGYRKDVVMVGEKWTEREE